MKHNKLTVVIVIMMMALIVAACGSGNNISPSQNTQQSGSNQSEKQTQYRNELRMALDAQPPTLDPTMTTAVATELAVRPVFENLVTINSQFQTVPMLASSVDISPDGTTYEFQLRKGVKFHNGKEMTAEDVMASIDRWIEKISSAEILLKDAKIEAKDEHTVVIQLQEPILDLLYTMASFQYVIMPKEVIESADATGVTEFIGTGPYEFVEWRQDQYIHVTKYDEYQPVDTPADGLSGKKEALVKDIYMDIVPDISARLSGIQSGLFDIALRLPTENYDVIKNDNNLEVKVQLNAIYAAIFNKKEGLFANLKMREAVNAALEHESILLAAFADPDFYRLDSSYMWEEQADWHSSAGAQNYNQNDKEKAKRLLDEAGYNGEVIRILTTRDYPHYYDGSIVIQQQLQDAGMNVELAIFDWPTVVQKRSEPAEWDILMGATPFVSTPSQLLLLSPSFAGWTDDPEIAEGLKQLSSAASVAEASEIWDNVQGRVWDYLPSVNIGTFFILAASTNDVEGFEMFQGPVLWNTMVKQ